jgi:ligand-binding sensor domain-containing protein
VLCATTLVGAIDPERSLSQYIRDQWGLDRGFPGGPVNAIAQTADGYLWIAAEKGLVRFDGLTFRLFEPSGLAAGTGPTVLGVAADVDGSLWARLRGPSLVRYRHGVAENIEISGVDEVAVVTAMTPRRDGTILLAPLNKGVMSMKGGRLSTVVPTSAMASSFIIALAEASNGEIWMGTRDAGLLRVDGARVFPLTKGLPDPKVNCLLAGERGGLWIGTDRGVARLSGREVTTTGLPAGLEHVPALALARDRDGSVWIAAGARGLLRVHGDTVAGLEGWDARARGNATAVFEDREGNLWVGTTRGIERLRDGVLTTWSGSQGVPSDAIGPIHVDDAGRTWFAPAAGGLAWMRDGERGAITGAGLASDIVYSIAGNGPDLWVGRQRGGLTHLTTSGSHVGIENFTQADGLAQSSVYAVMRARDGAVWAGTLSAGVSRLANGRFTTWTAADGLASNTVATMLETADGTLWFGTPNGLSAKSASGWRRYATRDGLPSNDINALYEDASGDVWIGTALGLAVVRDGRVQRIAASTMLRTPIFGMAEDRRGGLWMATADRLLRINRTRLASGQALAEGDLREYGVADGVVNTEGVKRHRSVVADARGRIWFATRLGLSMASPARVSGSGLPALAHVDEVAADGHAFDLRQPLRVSSGHQRVTVTFAGLSLAAPERVRFRYRLDGFDHGWSEPVSARQAVYTNLAPGPYVFRVTASNSDGEWHGREATIRFEVEPAYWQTTWVRVSVLALVAAAGWALYRLRLVQVASRLNLRFEERLGERTRIAQELHDTLLQGFVSASMQLHVAAEKLPPDSPAKPSLVHVLALMGQVVEEGRNAVRGLRSAPAGGDDLEQAFCRIPGEFAADDAVAFRVLVEGAPRPLHPLIRDDVYRIGREALVNAFRHARAARVEVELEFAAGHVRLLVRDDGCGIDDQVLRSGREGHWGLSGMRERAERIGARLEVWSRAAAGTEVALVVPNHVAFQQPPPAGRVGRLAAIGAAGTGFTTRARATWRRLFPLSAARRTGKSAP